VAGGAAPLVTVPAAELCYDLSHPTPGDEPGTVGEFLAYGIDNIPDDPGGDRANWFVNEAERYEQRTFPSATAGARWATEQGAVTYAAHPYWTGLDPAVLLAAEGFSGLEVFNGSSEIETGRGDSSPWWDALLGAGRAAFAIATDDQHYPLFELGLAWTMLRAADRSRESAIEALRTGMAYCSNGPAIVQVDTDADGSVEVACSPCRAVVLAMEAEWGVSVVAGERGRRLGAILEADGSGLITRARLDVPSNDVAYRRVIVVDAGGRRAWTNPLP
jgi:hypothetical protein